MEKDTPSAPSHQRLRGFDSTFQWICKNDDDASTMNDESLTVYTFSNVVIICLTLFFVYEHEYAKSSVRILMIFYEGQALGQETLAIDFGGDLSV